jgi:hypothetical protein
MELAVAQAHARFDDATIREFVPVMVERTARASLLATVGAVPVPLRGGPLRT